jgi:hypothetical protein
MVVARERWGEPNEYDCGRGDFIDLLEGLVMKRRLLILIPCCALVACSGDGPIGPNGPIVARPGAGTTTAALEIGGAWQRRLFFVDDYAFARETETTWQFLSDGTAVRTEIARNLTLGLADVVISTGRWSLTGTVLTIDFVSPFPGRIQLEAGITGNELDLAGEVFLRVAS